MAKVHGATTEELEYANLLRRSVAPYLAEGMARMLEDHPKDPARLQCALLQVALKALSAAHARGDCIGRRNTSSAYCFLCNHLRARHRCRYLSDFLSQATSSSPSTTATTTMAPGEDTVALLHEREMLQREMAALDAQLAEARDHAHG
eukprot:3719656-Pleurochrysis_carterae.AAC.1